MRWRDALDVDGWLAVLEEAALTAVAALISIS